MDNRQLNPDETESRTSSDDGGGAAPTEDAAAREREELHNRLLRTAADFDNYRKRVERERREWSDAAAIDVIRDILPSIDDLERALAAPRSGEPGGGRDTALRKGIELIHQKLMDVLKRRGVEAIVTVGADFDPNVHEAIASEPAAGRRDDEVIAELQRGYKLRDRLVRPATVKVAKA